MIFHPGRTGSCIMRPRRAVSCLLKLNPPARIGKKENRAAAPPRTHDFGTRPYPKMSTLGPCPKEGAWTPSNSQGTPTAPSLDPK